MYNERMALLLTLPDMHFRFQTPHTLAYVCFDFEKMRPFFARHNAAWGVHNAWCEAATYIVKANVSNFGYFWWFDVETGSTALHTVLRFWNPSLCCASARRNGCR